MRGGYTEEQVSPGGHCPKDFIWCPDGSDRWRSPPSCMGAAVPGLLLFPDRDVVHGLPLRVRACGRGGHRLPILRENLGDGPHHRLSLLVRAFRGPCVDALEGRLVGGLGDCTKIRVKTATAQRALSLLGVRALIAIGTPRWRQQVEVAKLSG